MAAVEAYVAVKISEEAHLMSPDELAANLGVARRTLSRWHRLRSGPARICVGKKLFYRVKSVEAWLKRKEDTFSK